MARIARHQGVTVIERPPDLSAASVPLEAIVADGYRQIVGHVGMDLEALVVLLCNAPTVTADMINKGIEVLRNNAAWDAVASVSLHNEFNPRYALRLGLDDRLEPYSAQVTHDDQVFFPDALIWVLRPRAYFESARLADGWLTNFSQQAVAPLIHEGVDTLRCPD
jgi:hypothetical protein